MYRLIPIAHGQSGFIILIAPRRGSNAPGASTTNLLASMFTLISTAPPAALSLSSSCTARLMRRRGCHTTFGQEVIEKNSPSGGFMQVLSLHCTFRSRDNTRYFFGTHYFSVALYGRDANGAFSVIFYMSDKCR